LPASANADEVTTATPPKDLEKVPPLAATACALPLVEAPPTVPAAQPAPTPPGEPRPIVTKKGDPIISTLLLGAKLDGQGHPRNMWREANTGVRELIPEALVTVPANALLSHTIIVAQSGSGKSSFLGRLVEEILTKTGAKCLVVDPNSDFRFSNKIVDARDFESSAGYDHKSGKGKLHTSPNPDHFAELWKNVGISIFLGRYPREKHEVPEVLVKVRWPYLSFDLLSEDLDVSKRADFRQCHRFFRAVATGVESRARELRKIALEKGRPIPEKELDIVNLVLQVYEDLPSPISALSEEKRASKIEDHVETLLRLALDFPPDVSTPTPAEKLRTPSEGHAVETLILVPSEYERAANALGYFQPDQARQYFGVLARLNQSDLLTTKPRDPSPNDLEVLDLPSIEDPRLSPIVVSAQLHLELSRAKRAWETVQSGSIPDLKPVPRFIVVDEAHNVMPANPTTRAQQVLRDQFQTIAAEGRKYGLFLILATQRPDKLDAAILSECETSQSCDSSRKPSWRLRANPLAFQN
jgi:uncharacterized protein DUF87/ATPase family protein associated with various cellular activities (AAA)